MGGLRSSGEPAGEGSHWAGTEQARMCPRADGGGLDGGRSQNQGIGPARAAGLTLLLSTGPLLRGKSGTDWRSEIQSHPLGRQVRHARVRPAGGAAAGQGRRAGSFLCKFGGAGCKGPWESARPGRQAALQPWPAPPREAGGGPLLLPLHKPQKAVSQTPARAPRGEGLISCSCKVTPRDHSLMVLCLRAEGPYLPAQKRSGPGQR